MSADPRASGLLLGDGVEIGDEVSFGANVVVREMPTEDLLESWR